MLISQAISIGLFQPTDMILALPNEDQRRDKNQKKSTFSETQQVWTTRCTLLFFWGGSKVKVYIGIVHFWINSLKMTRPQDVVASDNERNGKFNFDRERYWAHHTTHYPPDISEIFTGFCSSRKSWELNESWPDIQPPERWYHRVLICRGIIGMPLFCLSNWPHFSWITKLVHAIMPIRSWNFKGSTNRWLQNQLLTIF